MTVGDQATYSCDTIKQDTDFSISWEIDGVEYFCDGPNTAKNDTHSVLQIEHTTALGVRNLTVHCTLRQKNPQQFIEDPSYLPVFSNDITMKTSLNITNKLFVASKYV